jgi:hypothetical protein
MSPVDAIHASLTMIRPTAGWPTTGTIGIRCRGRNRRVWTGRRNWSTLPSKMPRATRLGTRT